MDPDAAALAPFASQIGPGVYISDPKQKDVESSARQPLVFLGFWMNAPAGQLARYLSNPWIVFRIGLPYANTPIQDL